MVTQAPREPHTLDAMPDSPKNGLVALVGRVGETLTRHRHAVVASLGIMIASASSGPVLATNKDSTTPSNTPSASADKGGGQVLLLNDGTSITFADFGTKGPEEQEKVLGMVGIRDRIRARSWLAQVANQRKESELAGLQMANQTLRVEQQGLIADALVYMERVEKTKELVNPKIIQGILATEEKSPGVIPPILLKWAQSHNKTTIASVAGR